MTCRRPCRRGDTSLSTRHWVSAVQAETFARLGDHASCERALERAEQVRQLDGPVHNGGWLRFDGSRLAEERGTCYVALGRHDLAETALTGALPRGLTPRRHASVLTDLAMIGVRRRDPDRVVTYAQAALITAQKTGSKVISRRLESLQLELGPDARRQAGASAEHQDRRADGQCRHRVATRENRCRSNEDQCSAKRGSPVSPSTTPGEPKPSYITPWGDTPDWERTSATAVYDQVRAFVETSDGNTAKLTRVQKGRFSPSAGSARSTSTSRTQAGLRRGLGRHAGMAARNRFRHLRAH